MANIYLSNYWNNDTFVMTHTLYAGEDLRNCKFLMMETFFAGFNKRNCRIRRCNMFLWFCEVGTGADEMWYRVCRCDRASLSVTFSAGHLCGQEGRHMPKCHQRLSHRRTCVNRTGNDSNFIRTPLIYIWERNDVAAIWKITLTHRQRAIKQFNHRAITRQLNSYR